MDGHQHYRGFGYGVLHYFTGVLLIANSIVANSIVANSIVANSIVANSIVCRS